MKRHQITIVLKASLISILATIAQIRAISVVCANTSPFAFQSFLQLHPSKSTSQSIHKCRTRSCNRSIDPTAIPKIAKFSPATELQLQTNFHSQYQLQQFHSSPFSITMPRGIKKENLPSKTCITCERPFTWRKKWEKCWDEVTTCSKSCNRKRRQENSSSRLMMKQQQHEEERVNVDAATDAIGIGVADIIIGSDGDEGAKDDESKEQGYGESQEEHVPPPSKDKDNGDGDDDISYGNGEEVLKELNLLSNNDHDNESKLTSEDEEEEFPLLTDPDEIQDPIARKKALRKAEKKRKKQERRAQREGRGDKSAGQKQCDMCSKSVDLLIRCTYDESLDWKMICGKCWNVASGGVVDGDKDHPYYRYGGLWKNRRRK